MARDLAKEMRAVVARRRWPPTTPFGTRLAALRDLMQEHFDGIPQRSSLAPRVALTIRMRLDDLAAVLPPGEGRVLAHLLARRPLADLLGRPGFPSTRRLNERLQRLLSRVQKYCGSAVRHRLMQPYDRPGHDHRRRPGRPRRLQPVEGFPELRVWIPRWFSKARGFAVSEGPVTEVERKRVLRRMALTDRHSRRTPCGSQADLSPGRETSDNPSTECGFV
jgi:hypothetical protein